ncbi:hypothetical protein CK516_36845 [Nostoc sp. 'Peltigera malacea cyanobiont' DB3992]|nr:hypothetical protein CK516_36845 [Nostoc sp. 'Peltigera malacea cyanobiont' DB3992]
MPAIIASVVKIGVCIRDIKNKTKIIKILTGKGIYKIYNRIFKLHPQNIANITKNILISFCFSLKVHKVTAPQDKATKRAIEKLNG